MPRIPEGVRPSTRDPKTTQTIFNWEFDAILLYPSVSDQVYKWANYMMGSDLMGEDIAFDPPFDSKDDGDLDY